MSSTPFIVNVGGVVVIWASRTRKTISVLTKILPRLERVWKGMKMKMLDDQAEYYDYLDDEEVWAQLYRFEKVLFWHQFL